MTVALLINSLRTSDTDETPMVRWTSSKRYLDFLRHIVFVEGSTMEMNACMHLDCLFPLRKLVALFANSCSYGGEGADP